jgi:hypothetical protein
MGLINSGNFFGVQAGTGPHRITVYERANGIVEGLRSREMGRVLSSKTAVKPKASA